MVLAEECEQKQPPFPSHKDWLSLGPCGKSSSEIPELSRQPYTSSELSPQVSALSHTSLWSIHRLLLHWNFPMHGLAAHKHLCFHMCYVFTAHNVIMNNSDTTAFPIQCWFMLDWVRVRNTFAHLMNLWSSTWTTCKKKLHGRILIITLHVMYDLNN